MTKNQKCKTLDLHRESVLAVKKTEYSKGCNRHRNFEVASEFVNEFFTHNNVTALDAILFLSSKHYASIKMAMEGEIPFDNDFLLEKCGDFLNYYDLFILYMQNKGIRAIDLINEGFNFGLLKQRALEVREFFINNYRTN